VKRSKLAPEAILLFTCIPDAPLLFLCIHQRFDATLPDVLRASLDKLPWYWSRRSQNEADRYQMQWIVWTVDENSHL